MCKDTVKTTAGWKVIFSMKNVLGTSEQSKRFFFILKTPLRTTITQCYLEAVNIFHEAQSESSTKMWASCIDVNLGHKKQQGPGDILQVEY